MTIPFAKHSLFARNHPSQWLLLFAVFIAVAVATPAHAADSAANQWQGIYHSNALNKDVSVLLTLPADEKPGELQFVTLSCAVGLQPASAAQMSTAVYNIVPQQDAVAGPYCGNWLGGRVETRSVDRFLQMTVTKGASKITLKYLEPTSGMR